MLTFCTTLDELLKTLDDRRALLWVAATADFGKTQWSFDLPTEVVDGKRWSIARVAKIGEGPSWDGYDDGIGAGEGIALTEELGLQVVAEFNSPTAPVSRRSTLPFLRAFAYVDISDYSKMPAGLQLMVVRALVEVAEGVEKDTGGEAEAKLCIGDGYIYVWDSAIAATRFAANLLKRIEHGVAERKIPEFHVRIGVHVGPVRWFRDPGRGADGWNYVGDGINGGNRVLSAIGKDTDDVVFVSGEVRQAILVGQPGALLGALHNRGRRADKHGNLWRVYELNHSAIDWF